MTVTTYLTRKDGGEDCRCTCPGMCCCDFGEASSWVSVWSWFTVTSAAQSWLSPRMRFCGRTDDGGRNLPSSSLASAQRGGARASTSPGSAASDPQGPLLCFSRACAVHMLTIALPFPHQIRRMSHKTGNHFSNHNKKKRWLILILSSFHITLFLLVLNFKVKM